MDQLSQTKVCSHCQIEKHISEFTKRGYHCKLCASEIDRKSREKNKAKRAITTKTWQDANPDKQKQYRDKHNFVVQSETKHCTKCDTTQLIENFIGNGPKKFIKIYCNPCFSVYEKESRLKHKDKRNETNRAYNKRNYTQNAPILRIRQKAMKEANPKNAMLVSVKQGAKMRNLEFSITTNDFEIPTYCPLLGIPMFFHPRIIGEGRINHRSDSVTIDRIDNSKGYIPGNVWVISHKANQCKSSLSVEELRTFATNILKFIPEPLLNTV